MPRSLGTEGATHPMQRPWVTATFKEPVSGPVRLGPEGLMGDGQADRRVHGGPEKALLAYCAEHYAFWRERLGRQDIGPGGFGENLAMEGTDEGLVCIGDSYRIGTTRVQVSQPRTPCWKQARRWERKDMVLLIQQSGKTGWYYRVLEQGTLQAGDTVELLERPFPALTIARANGAMYGEDEEAASELAACPLLASEWVEPMRRRAR